MADAERCPTCRAPFREMVECARCGTDLSPLMAAIASAHRLREAGRLALLDPARRPESLAPLRRARELEDGQRARTLLFLAALLAGDKDDALGALRTLRARPSGG